MVWSRYALILWCLSALPATAVELHVTYLRQIVPQPATLSNLDPLPEDLGPAGAALGREDNATTGAFLGHDYTLTVSDVALGGDLRAAAIEALQVSPYLIIEGLPQDILTVADLPEAADAVLFNASSGQNDLREAECRANLLHTLPSDAMRADAVMQFFVMRRWDDLVMVSGTHPDDMAFATALQGAAEKFGLSIGATKDWVFDADMRRNAPQEVPLFTQDLGDYDALLVADELGDFGRYIAYNTWRPRPIAGSEGLVPTGWSDVVEQWGAAQLQNRFEDQAGRPMRSRDYAAWAAMRALGEAVTRTGSADATTLRDYLLSDAFELAGFKGRPLSFRAWNGQLRQPIPLVQPRALVAMAPLDGFLHQTTELDTLGRDEPESLCRAFAEAAQ